MINLDDIVLLILVSLMIAFTWRATAVREYAVQAVKKHLRQLDLQLLDDTVAWRGWCRQGWQWFRVYRFEFSSMGNERYSGTISMSGFRVRDITLQAYRVERPEHEALH